jgi:hypothetical protein
LPWNYVFFAIIFYVFRQWEWYNPVMTTIEPPQALKIAAPREPWRHILVFVGVAAALFVMSVVLFCVLERAL